MSGELYQLSYTRKAFAMTTNYEKTFSSCEGRDLNPLSTNVAFPAFAMKI